MNNMNLEIKNEKNIKNELVTEKQQNSFLESSLGQAINFAFDIGLRALLPNFIEDGVIGVKNVLLKEGLQEGIKSVINSGIDLGKSIIGIFTGKFENVNQMQTAVQKGGIIDGTSKLIDTVLLNVQKGKLLPNNVITTIRKGKDVILDSVSKNIEDTLTVQIKEIEKIDSYLLKWKEAFEKQDFSQMEKEYKKIEKSLVKTMPLEQTIKNAREIENIHNLIKNNGHNFNLTENEIELTKKLIS